MLGRAVLDLSSSDNTTAQRLWLRGVNGVSGASLDLLVLLCDEDHLPPPHPQSPCYTHTSNDGSFHLESIPQLDVQTTGVRNGISNGPLAEVERVLNNEVT